LETAPILEKSANFTADPKLIVCPIFVVGKHSSAKPIVLIGNNFIKKLIKKNLD
jgi:hypothetical protein